MTFSEDEVQKLLHNAEFFLESELLSLNVIKEYKSSKMKFQNRQKDYNLNSDSFEESAPNGNQNLPEKVPLYSKKDIRKGQ